MDSTSSESAQPVVVAGEDSMPLESSLHRPPILEALVSKVTALIRIVVKMARKVPIVGSTIGIVEDTASPVLDPVIGQVEKDGLFMLSLVDKKIHIVSDLAMVYVPFAAIFIPELQAILSGQPIDMALTVFEKVRTRGIVGFTADVWVNYEPTVKREGRRIYNWVIKVPCLQTMVFILNDISSPLISSASDWLIMHSEVKDKHEIFLPRDVSPPALDSPVMTAKAADGEDHKVGDLNAQAEESESDPQHSSDFPDSESGEGKGAASNSEGEIDDSPVEEGESVSSDKKGKFPELSVVHEDEDAVSDLFDTWGLGVKGVNPRALNQLRSMSMTEGTGSKKPPPRPKSKSFRF